MFTGLIEACTAVRRVEPRGAGIRLWIASPGPDWELRSGQSIALSGVCLSLAAAADPATGALVPFERVRVERTGPEKRGVERPAVEKPGPDLGFDLSSETLARTWFEDLAPGRKLNLERALCIGDRLDGHLVAGHVDGVARIVAIEDTRDGGRRFGFEVEPELSRYLVDKGSVTLDGISLTVVAPRGPRFDVAVIPITLAQTSLGDAQIGQRVNVEADMLGKWIDRLLVARG